MEKKKTVVVYESFYEAIQLLSTDEARMALFNGMMNYGLYGEEPTFSTPELKLSWTFYKPNMDANMARYNKAVESGRKSAGNRLPKKEEPAKEVVIPKETPVEVKVSQPETAQKAKLIKRINATDLNQFDKEMLITRVNDGNYTTNEELTEAMSYII